MIGEFEGAELVQAAPMMRGRVVRIGGVAADQSGIEHWTLRRDRGLSYAAAMPAGTELVAGEWWPEDYSGPPLVSVEDEVGEAYGVGIGDTLGFNILGRVIEAEIANLRAEIDWGEARLDFVFLLSPGVLEAAPHTSRLRSTCRRQPRPRCSTGWPRSCPTSRRSRCASWSRGSTR